MAQITLNSSGVASSSSLLLQTNGTTTQATVDTSGNLGLGVTPSAWSTGKAIQIGTLQAGIWGAGDQIDICGNAYYNAGWKAAATKAGATLYEMALGTHAWSVSGSVTAGNAITFTQAMTLDASGNLGIGTTSPSGRLDVVTASGSTYINARRNSQSTGEVGLNLYGGTGGQNWGIYIPQSSNDLRFYTNGADRVSIDSSGNLLVGTTSQIGSDRLVVDNTIGINSAGGFEPQINFNSSNASIEFVNRNSGGSKTFKWYYQASAAGSPATLSTSGVWTNASDARGKENISGIHYGLATVMALTPRQYDVKSDGSHAIGFVAQEVLPVVPELVHVTQRTEDDEFYGLDYGSMTAVLVKAIQELKAIVDAQAAEIVALKG